MRLPAALQHKGQLTIKQEKIRLERIVQDVIDLCQPLVRTWPLARSLLCALSSPCLLHASLHAARAPGQQQRRRHSGWVVLTHRSAVGTHRSGP